MTVAFVYKWTHIPSLKWYVGSRTAKGCHPDDGYIASAKLLKNHILENKDEWKREIISIDSVKNVLKMYKKRTTLVRGKEHPQKGQKRPTITGDKHPNKNPLNAAKISKSHTGKKHPYQEGDKNVMHRPEVVKQFLGKNHWTNKIENQLTCEHCYAIMMKSNYTRWHGKKCKLK